MGMGLVSMLLLLLLLLLRSSSTATTMLPSAEGAPVLHRRRIRGRPHCSAVSPVHNHALAWDC